MTTHYQKIQALGNRMAENLTIMGVPSQFDEGGLTLADKILEISSGITTGLLLYGDKKVAQSGDTVNLSMMVLEDGEFQPNTNVILHETILDKTYSTYSSISKSIGDNWVIEGPFENIISSSDTSGTTITAWVNGKLTVSVGGATVYHDSEAGSISKISYINKILSYNNKTVDLTEYNASFNVLSNVNAGRIIVKTAYVLTTDTHGLATHAYTCSGSGLKEFYATSGTFVSEIYEVLDCAFLDAMTTGKKNNKWVNQSNCYTVGEPTDNGTKLTKVSNGNYTPSSVANSTNWNDKLTFTPPLKVEFEITDINGTVQLRIMDSNTYPITLTTGVYEIFISSTGITFKRNGGNEETLTTNTISDCNVSFATTGSSSADITIKDFKVYPI